MPCDTPLLDYHCHVLDHRTVGNRLKLLTLRPVYAPGDPEFHCEAGQFVMIDLPTPVFHFRRPMSVLTTYESGVFEIFYKIHGRGTAMMAELQPGDELNVLGPLGNTFSLPADPDSALLVGGGIGIAPLYFLGKALKESGQPVPSCYYGVRSQREIGLLEPLTQVFGDCLHIATDDGSCGTPGNVCHLLNLHESAIRQAKEAYICGPTVMMKAASTLLKTLNPAIRTEVSLEEHMPCGTGACTGCVVFRTDRLLPSKTCVEGPVFPVESIVWPTDDPFPRGGNAEAAACATT